ncbi:hypothetical protein PPL_09708 [Heterostelium album PN500]|uniref:Uncharacterized protein n=1 Tax=Heterostelium pallidum (strain ATCC 26659 / Pp 5 / PN500) TaxID=670386 RepID=D3BNK5_HETP5|nr:hypothetical protein PPL_09708 [Heterostelium album PN500]EFA76956.1 hypothetical protein PPL_09708 [Heterostelium album PN500]|eukprot:XP_020429088.1 hypothetical protein PPL_09708 [Heterostelium album PN500]
MSKRSYDTIVQNKWESSKERAVKLFSSSASGNQAKSTLSLDCQLPRTAHSLQTIGEPVISIVRLGSSGTITWDLLCSYAKAERSAFIEAYQWIYQLIGGSDHPFESAVRLIESGITIDNFKYLVEQSYQYSYNDFIAAIDYHLPLFEMFMEQPITPKIYKEIKERSLLILGSKNNSFVINSLLDKKEDVFDGKTYWCYYDFFPTTPLDLKVLKRFHDRNLISKDSYIINKLVPYRIEKIPDLEVYSFWLDNYLDRQLDFQIAFDKLQENYNNHPLNVSTEHPFDILKAIAQDIFNISSSPVEVNLTTFDTSSVGIPKLDSELEFHYGNISEFPPTKSTEMEQYMNEYYPLVLKGWEPFMPDDDKQLPIVQYLLEITYPLLSVNGATAYRLESIFKSFTFYIAVGNGLMEIVQFMNSKVSSSSFDSAWIDKYGLPIETALFNRQYDMMEYLLQTRPTEKLTKENIEMIGEYGDTYAYRIFLQHSPDNFCINELIYLAGVNGRVALINLVLSDGKLTKYIHSQTIGLKGRWYVVKAFMNSSDSQLNKTNFIHSIFRNSAKKNNLPILKLINQHYSSYLVNVKVDQVSIVECVNNNGYETIKFLSDFIYIDTKYLREVMHKSPEWLATFKTLMEKNKNKKIYCL